MRRFEWIQAWQWNSQKSRIIFERIVWTRKWFFEIYNINRVWRQNYFLKNQCKSRNRYSRKKNSFWRSFVSILNRERRRWRKWFCNSWVSLQKRKFHCNRNSFVVRSRERLNELCDERFRHWNFFFNLKTHLLLRILSWIERLTKYQISFSIKNFISSITINC